MIKKNSYSHLKIDISKKCHKKIKSGFDPNFYYFDKFYFPLLKFISKFKKIKQLAQLIIEINQSFESKQKNISSIYRLNNYHHLSDKQANEFGSGFGYDDNLNDLRTCISYYSEVKNNFIDQSESKKLYSSINDIYSILIEKYKINNFLNFGSSYCYIDSLLAKTFPKTNFLCCDRSLYIQNLNEKIFSDIENMNFIHGDIINFLQNNKYNNDIFFTARVVHLLPREFIEKLYKTVYNSGFRFISLMEQVGLSRETFKSYVYSDEDKQSILYRGKMYLHNYPGILKKCGYNIIDSKLINTDHLHEDFRILHILAEKSS